MADKRNGKMFYLGQDHALYAELFQRIGDQLKAKENLNKSIEIFKECGADGWVEKYEKELAALLWKNIPSTTSYGLGDNNEITDLHY